MISQRQPDCGRDEVLRGWHESMWQSFLSAASTMQVGDWALHALSVPAESIGPWS